MKDYTEEEINYIKQNKEEVINFISSKLKMIDKELKNREMELLQLPTKEDRIERVIQISKELRYGNE